MLRVGMGYDIHRLSEGRKLVLGGVEIPHSKGPVGHSDGDVLIHAIIDALLGACSLGDIGRHFPDDDPRYKDIPSTELLTRALTEVGKLGTVENIDSTVVADRPRLSGFVNSIRERIAAAVGVTPARVSVKAKTAEGLGAVGEGKAIEAYAVALVRLNT